MCGGAADVDDTGALKVFAEHVDDPIPSRFIKRIEHLVDEDPGRRVEKRSRKREALLFVVSQFPIPAQREKKKGYQGLKAKPVQNRPEGIFIEPFHVQRVGENLAQ